MTWTTFFSPISSAIESSNSNIFFSYLHKGRPINWHGEHCSGKRVHQKVNQILLFISIQAYMTLWNIQNLPIVPFDPSLNYQCTPIPFGGVRLLYHDSLEVVNAVQNFQQLQAWHKSFAIWSCGKKAQLGTKT